MLDFLQKFNDLPSDLRNVVSTPEVIAALGELEKKYRINLATVVMRVMIKDIRVVDLAKFLVFEFSLDARLAEDLVTELKQKIFFGVLEYLGLVNESESAVSASVMPHAENEMLRDRLAVRSSGFFFSPDDEKEVQELAKKVESFKNQPSVVVREIGPLEKMMLEINGYLHINFSSDDLRVRFDHVITTYLKGIRNKIDAKQTLLKRVDHGGLGMEEVSVEKVMSVVDRVKAKYEEPKMTLIPKMVIPSERLEKKKGIKRDVDYDYSKLKEAAQNIEEKKTEAPKSPPKPPQTFKPIEVAGALDKINLEEMKAASEPSVINPVAEIASKEEIKVPKFNMPMEDNSSGRLKDLSNATNALPQKSVDPIIPPIEIKNPEPKIEIKRIENPVATSPKRNIDDVKKAPKLVGPIEELQSMSVAIFRRLSQSPKEAIAKINAKIELLEDEGYSKRLEGVKAWRQSPINRLYISIGQEAINQSSNIETVIKNWTTQGKECLRADEFQVIMDLNKNLRF